MSDAVMPNTVAEAPGAFDERLREEAAAAGRAALDVALQRFTVAQRDAFWNAIGLYYSTRRHPGAGEIPADAPVA